MSTRYSTSPKSQSKKPAEEKVSEEVKSIWEEKPRPILPEEPKTFFGKGNFEEFRKDVSVDVGRTTLFWAGLLFCCFLINLLLRKSDLVEKVLYAGQAKQGS